MAKKKDEKVEETTDAATEEVVEEISEAKAESSKKKEEKEDASLVEEVVDAVEETASGVAETAVEAVEETASDVVEAVTGNDDEEPTEKKGRKRNEKVGIVHSDKMTNTVVVRVNRMVKHQLYHKYMKKRKKFMAHDEMGAAVGDRVRIVETRPLSAKKRRRVVEILQKAVK